MQQSKSCWAHLAGIVLLTMLSTLFALLLPLPLKMVVDCIVSHQPVPSLLVTLLPNSWTASVQALLLLCAGMLLIMGALVQIQVLVSWMLQTYTGERLVHEFRSSLFWHVQRLRLEFHERKGTSDIAYRIQHDAPAIQTVTIQGIAPFVTAVFSFIGMAYVTARMDWQLALIAFILCPGLAWLSRSSSRKVRQGWHEVKTLDSSAMSVLTEVLSAVRLVKAFNREGDEDERFEMRSNKRMQRQLRLAATQASYYCATAMLISIGTAAALWVGAKHVQSGQLTLGSLLVVMSYMTQLYEPLRTMSNKVPEIQSALVSAERAFALLEEVPEPLANQTGTPLVRAIGSIEFQGVTFRYPSGRKVLEDVSFKIAAGTRVGVLGPTGAGKSTLVSLLTRFYEAEKGRILLDGVDVREYRLADLRRQFAIVPQDPVLFSTSIADNIAFSQPDVRDEAIIEAAKAANAHDFICALPAGYLTPVGDRGSRLSGGERQRIAIARAFLKQAPILILDEPTSAVDMKTEAAVMGATRHLLEGRTSFMIAHRLSTLENCDVLLCFDEDKLSVVEEDIRGFLYRKAAAENSFSLEELFGFDPKEEDVAAAKRS
jgi:ATP-binding cassette subfamily B protein